MTEHPNLAAALVAALADCSVVDKGRTAKIEHKGGGAHSYEYADLSDVVKLTRPKLAEHGLVVLTPIEEHGNGLKCTVVLLHSSGERMDFGPFPFPHGQTAQATGSMVTYYRRYALVSALGIAAGDDDDGATAHARQPEVRPEPKPVHPKVQKLVDSMNGIADEAIRVAVKSEFKAQYGLPADFDLNRLEEAELFIVETVQDLTPKTATPEAGDQQGPADGPTSVEASTSTAAPAPASPVTKPATAKPSAAARAALAGEKPALGAVKRTNDAPSEAEVVEHLEQAFPGSEREAS